MILKSLFHNAKRPGVNCWGSIMLWMMGHGHQRMQLWTQRFFKIPQDGMVLDIGCGGGRYIDNMRKTAPNAIFHGLDYSPLCIKKSTQYHKDAVKDGKAFFSLGSVEALPFDDDSFDLATASETIYFWPNPRENFKEVLRILKPSGFFLICNEVAEPKQAEKWIDMVGKMNIYRGDELTGMLRRAGFRKAESHLHSKGHWLCVIAQK